MTHRLRLDYPDGDGFTLRDHLQSVYDQVGILDPQLTPPDGGEEAEYLLAIFWSVNTSSAEGRITATSLLDWCQLHRQQLVGWEVEMILHLDGVLQRWLAERYRKESRSSLK